MNIDDNQLKIPNQCNRLKAYLSAMGSCTTIEARQLLDIWEPASRVVELKRQGIDIVTRRVLMETPHGGTRRVAQYILKTGGLAQ